MSKSKANATKYTHETLIGLQIALRRLGDGGFDRVVGTGEKATTVQELYKLGDLRLPIAQNLNKIDAAIKAYSDARDGIIKEISGGQEIAAAATDQIAAFNEAHAKLIKSEVDIDLVRISAKALKLGENPIPSSMLVLLAPILDDF